jgi:hypothetical protein
MMPRGGTPVGSVDRHVGYDRPGRLMEPGLCQPHHVGALLGGKTAAGMTDEKHDRAVGFRDRDRMPLAIIGGGTQCGHWLVGMRAGTEQDGETGKRSRQAEAAIAIEGHIGCHRLKSSSRLSR